MTGGLLYGGLVGASVAEYHIVVFPVKKPRRMPQKNSVTAPECKHVSTPGSLIAKDRRRKTRVVLSGDVTACGREHARTHTNTHTNTHTHTELDGKQVAFCTGVQQNKFSRCTGPGDPSKTRVALK